MIKKVNKEISPLATLGRNDRTIPGRNDRTMLGRNDGVDSRLRGNDKWPLFIGRFQPLHLGHLSVIKDILKAEGKILIGIGSAEESFLPDNPFTSSERIQMIEAVLKQEKISCEKFRIIPVRNINNYSLWVKHVQNIMPPFDKVYTSSKIVKRLFEAEGVSVEPTKIKVKVDATKVRKAILSEKGWDKMVPEAVFKFINKIDGVNRMKDI